jgi:hypothetical protein
MGWNAFFQRNYPKLKRLGIDLREVNSVKFTGWETLEHRFMKFLICHNIYRIKHNFKTEQSINGSVCDVIDLDSRIIYEIETNNTPRRAGVKIKAFCHPLIEDMLIVDIRKLDFDWSLIKKLSDEIAQRYGIIKSRI